MVKLPQPHPVEWRTGAPLWTEALKDETTGRFRQPALLRFAVDQFMEQLMAELAREQPSLARYVARPETWKAEQAGWLSQSEYAAATAAAPVKLYQPAQARFYLVAASLICAIPGLPDHTVNPSNGEKTSFVIRRLVKGDAGAVEHAWCPTGDQTGWVPAGAQPKAVLAAEERLPLFPVSLQLEGRRRRLWAGVIPVASRETYQAGPALTGIEPPGSAAGSEDPRAGGYHTRVVEALALLQQGAGVYHNLPGTETWIKAVSAAKEREISAFILLDLADFLNMYLPAVWACISAPPGPALSGAPKRVFDQLGQPLRPGQPATWADALRWVWQQREAVLTGDEEAFGKAPLNSAYNLRDAILPIQANDLTDALGPYDPAADRADRWGDDRSAPPSAPKFDPLSGDAYIIRCVFECPCCKLNDPVVSEPSQPFRLAGFYDPDAPVRPVRIALPVDTSIKGLRGFKKGVSFMVSSQLKGQIERVRAIKLKDLDDGKLGESGSLDFGMICTLSIPIITICALILLFIIVQLLNIIFWWLPFFKICFPIPRKG